MNVVELLNYYTNYYTLKTCRSVFNVLMCKFYKLYLCAIFGIIIEYIKYVGLNYTQ